MHLKKQTYFDFSFRVFALSFHAFDLRRNQPNFREQRKFPRGNFLDFFGEENNSFFINPSFVQLKVITQPF
jgi:hypothetical protein